MNGSQPFANPLYLTSYGPAIDSLSEGSLYSMTCKMIGSNDHNHNHFHFKNSNRINFGTTEALGNNVPEDLIDKITMIAMGVIVAIDTVKDPLYKGKTTVIATLKHTDYDPFTRMNVSWMTQHHIPPIRNMERAQVLCVIGREVQFTGLIRDYDVDKFMWACEVNAISVTSGHSANSKTSPKAPGKPGNGRTPSTMRPKVTAGLQSRTLLLKSDTDVSASVSGEGSGSAAETEASLTMEVAAEAVKAPTGPNKRARRE
ncbi:uncharacterized protein MELLADRAFT_84300 [Melampsora larici-populina 98AG31]|uniref:Uncharacterized protein n=1 Tax=Melampsora larici-populina (strain 98AG31 / pathotype 3-4-7) TaxID=747676 RepID=F4RF91_MELLP|nr:uncharacterized protein MELLADRAFT_84300 [Melampsora larici-populina 98AG31]EGG08771.1 hypothetical protein MELLADRAFT_84300 [Melampsora larici-populina 98AG31]